MQCRRLWWCFSKRGFGEPDRFRPRDGGRHLNGWFWRRWAARGTPLDTDWVAYVEFAAWAVKFNRLLSAEVEDHRFYYHCGEGEGGWCIMPMREEDPANTKWYKVNGIRTGTLSLEFPEWIWMESGQGERNRMHLIFQNFQNGILRGEGKRERCVCVWGGGGRWIVALRSE